MNRIYQMDFENNTVSKDGFKFLRYDNHLRFCKASMTEADFIMQCVRPTREQTVEILNERGIKAGSGGHHVYIQGIGILTCETKIEKYSDWN